MTPSQKANGALVLTLWFTLFEGQSGYLGKLGRLHALIHTDRHLRIDLLVRQHKFHVMPFVEVIKLLRRSRTETLTRRRYTDMCVCV